MDDIKKCIVCGNIIKKENFKSEYWFQMTKYCSYNCGKIFRMFTRKFPNKKFNSTHAKGLFFEQFVAKKYEEDGWNVSITKNSRGYFDLIVIKNNIIKCLQIKNDKHNKCEYDVKRLTEFIKQNSQIQVKIVYPDNKGGIIETDVKKHGEDMLN